MRAVSAALPVREAREGVAHPRRRAAEDRDAQGEARPRARGAAQARGRRAEGTAGAGGRGRARRGRRLAPRPARRGVPPAARRGDARGAPRDRSRLRLADAHGARRRARGGGGARVGRGGICRTCRRRASSRAWSPPRARRHAPEPERAPAPVPAGDEEIAIPATVARLGRRLLGLGQRALYHGLYDAKVVGIANVPHDRNVLVVANHASHLDMGLVKVALGEEGRRLAALAAQRLLLRHAREARLLRELHEPHPDGARGLAQGEPQGGRRGAPPRAITCSSSRRARAAETGSCSRSSPPLGTSRSSATWTCCPSTCPAPSTPSPPARACRAPPISRCASASRSRSRSSAAASRVSRGARGTRRRRR